MLNVVETASPERLLAAINYGFDRDEEMAGPFLDPLSMQSSLAQPLLVLVTQSTLSDPIYLDGLERHYAMVKRAATDTQHPAYADLRAARTGEGIDIDPPPEVE
jgi:hypothetical protein